MGKLLALLIALAGITVYLYRKRRVQRHIEQTGRDAERLLADRILNACKFSGLIPTSQDGQPAWIDLEREQVWSLDPDGASDEDFAERLGQLSETIEIDEEYVNGAASYPLCCVLAYPDDLPVSKTAGLPDADEIITLDPGPYLARGEWPAMALPLKVFAD